MPGRATADAAPAPTATTQRAAVATTVCVTGLMAAGNAFTGQLSHLTTSEVNGGLQLRGRITGDGLPAGGAAFAAPIRSLFTSRGCTILTLHLGALHLEAAGPIIDLAPVNLDVTAVPEAGGSLQSLLGAVTHLVDNGGPSASIAALLNVLLTGLGL